MTHKTKIKYSLNKIKEMFNHVRLANKISEDEYDLFCDAIRRLPPKIVKDVKDNVCFVLLSASRIEGGPACFIIVDHDLIIKKGIIILSALCFNLEPRESLYSLKICGNEFYMDLYHEIAHHVKGHRDTTDPELEKRNEDEANKLANKWFKDAFLKT